MITTIILTDGSTNKVEYITDIIGDNDGSFTVTEVRGLSTAEENLGMNFPKAVTNMQTFKTFASANSLRVEKFSNAGKTIVADYIPAS